ncbi:MAG: hypothetical protein ACE5FD_04940 [Anaerolineae bacterium]
MIQVTGATEREFTFPAEPATALAFYNDLGRITDCLTHITLEKQLAPDQGRVLYKTRELGAYTVRIFCDLQTIPDWNNLVLTVRPLENAVPIPPSSGFYSTQAYGRFASESRFYPDGAHTRIAYKLQLEARLPSPFGLRLIPGGVLNHIAASITNGRIHEIVNGFIQKSIAAFPQWQKQQLTINR